MCTLCEVVIGCAKAWREREGIWGIGAAAKQPEWKELEKCLVTPFLNLIPTDDGSGGPLMSPLSPRNRSRSRAQPPEISLKTPGLTEISFCYEAASLCTFV